MVDYSNNVGSSKKITYVSDSILGKIIAYEHLAIITGILSLIIFTDCVNYVVDFIGSIISFITGG